MQNVWLGRKSTSSVGIITLLWMCSVSTGKEIYRAVPPNKSKVSHVRVSSRNVTHVGPQKISLLTDDPKTRFLSLFFCLFHIHPTTKILADSDLKKRGQIIMKFRSNSIVFNTSNLSKSVSAKRIFQGRGAMFILRLDPSPSKKSLSFIYSVTFGQKPWRHRRLVIPKTRSTFQTFIG